MVPTREVELVPAQRELPAASDPALMFERLAMDPNVDVEKLERLIAMHERIIKHQAKAAFDAAFSEMQGEIPVITERGEIKVKGELRSKYATNEDIQEIVRPILQRHGFALRFRNEFDSGKLKIVGILSHRSGHSEQDEFVASADDSGSKNAIQALGSTRSYGQRYTTTALLCIATRGIDDDGQSSEKYKELAAPAGYDDWIGDITAVADEGWDKLKAAFNASPKALRDHLTVKHTATWETLKKIAAAKSKAAQK